MATTRSQITRTECVDLYIENAMDKLKAYVFKLQQRAGKKVPEIQITLTQQ